MSSKIKKKKESSLTKSKERVKELGEVFTPEHIVQQMIALIPDNEWQDPDFCYLEPTCGNGNIVIPMLRERLDSGVKLTQALNTMWGMDIMIDNIHETQERIYKEAKRYISENKLKLKTSQLINIVAIVENNIFRVDDSLTFMGEPLNNKPFFREDPTGQKQVLSLKRQQKLKEEIKYRCLMKLEQQPFSILFENRKI